MEPGPFLSLSDVEKCCYNPVSTAAVDLSTMSNKLNSLQLIYTFQLGAHKASICWSLVWQGQTLAQGGGSEIKPNFFCCNHEYSPIRLQNKNKQSLYYFL